MTKTPGRGSPQECGGVNELANAIPENKIQYFQFVIFYPDKTRPTVSGCFVGFVTQTTRLAARVRFLTPLLFLQQTGKALRVALARIFALPFVVPVKLDLLQ